MGHYSEMDFLFSSIPNSTSIAQQLNVNSDDNQRNIFRPQRYIVHKNKPTKDLSGNTISYNTNTLSIKNYLKDSVYKNSDSDLNPYVRILKDDSFNQPNNIPGAGLRIRAADLAYLKELGVYPMNRMVILRRFKDGAFVPENLEEMNFEPISTIVGWLPPDKSFGNITFSESWTLTNKRLDVLIADILQKATGIPLSVIPVPDFAQGLLFGFYQEMGLSGSVEDDTDYLESGWSDKNVKAGDTYGMSNIPVGDPNVLKEGPFRDPELQNIQSEFNFDFDTTYEQKLIGDVDPGSAMLDIIDNIMTMGTSNMSYYWNENSGLIKDLKSASSKDANDLNQWWHFVKGVMTAFWEAMKRIFTNILTIAKGLVAKAEDAAAASDSTAADAATKDKARIAEIDKTIAKMDPTRQASTIKGLQDEKDNLEKKSGPATTVKTALGSAAAATKSFALGLNELILGPLLQSMLASTISIHRFQIRGSIELMTGSRDSSAPWYLTIGNPYSPWLATNHIIVKSVSIDTSTEMGFNDQPQWIKATFQCKLSRALGRQELLRMFNNTYTRTYTDPKKSMSKILEAFATQLTKDQVAMSNKEATFEDTPLGISSPGHPFDDPPEDPNVLYMDQSPIMNPNPLVAADSTPTSPTFGGTPNPPGFVDAYNDWMGSQ